MSEVALTVTAGTPSEEELAAVLVALSTLPGPAEPPAPPQPSAWADRARAIEAPLHPGPGAWVASARRSAL